MSDDEIKMCIVVELANLTIKGAIEWSAHSYEDRVRALTPAAIRGEEPIRYITAQFAKYSCTVAGRTFELVCKGDEAKRFSMDEVYLVGFGSSVASKYPVDPVGHLHKVICKKTEQPLRSYEGILRELESLGNCDTLENL